MADVEPATQGAIYCRRCGYSLMGLSGSRCPECGRLFDPASSRTYDRDPRRWRSRRRERAILKVVLGLAAVLAIFETCLLCFYRPEWQREQAAIAALRQTDVSIETRRIPPGVNLPIPPADWLGRVPGPFNYMLERVTAITVRSGQLSKQQIASLKAFKHIEHLSLAVWLTDDDLTCLESMTRLDNLSLLGPPVANAGLARIGGLRQLKQLFLGSSSAGDEGLQHLANLKQLRRLVLGLNPSVTDKGLQQLLNLKQLTYLDLSSWQTGDAGLAALKDMTQIEQLTISTVGGGGVITDAGLAQLLNMKKMRELRLENTRISDAGLAQLQAFPNLKLLWITNDVWITDGGIPQLAAMKSLKSLILMGTAITPNGKRQLQQAMPATRVHYN